MISLRVNDIKQYAYCPRIVFYQYSMPVEKKATWKMEQGTIEEGGSRQAGKETEVKWLSVGGRRETVSFSTYFGASGTYRQTTFAHR